VTAAVTAAASLESSSVLPAAIMTGISNVALAVPRLVRVEVVECPLPAFRHRSYITMTRIVAVIDVAIEAMMTMEPRPSPNENAANEPIRPIIAVRSTVIRRIVEIPVWAHRRDSNADGNLSRRFWTAGEEHSSGKEQ